MLEAKGEYNGSVTIFCLYSRSKSSLRFDPPIWLPLKQLPRFFLLVLELLFLFSKFSPAVSLFPKGLKFHTLELGLHRRFVLASCFDKEILRLFSQSGYLLSSRVRPWLPSPGLCGEAGETLACWERIADDNGETAVGLQCDGGRLVTQPWRLAAHFEDCTLRLGCQFRCQRRRPSHLLRRSACPLSVFFLLPRSLAPRLSGSIPPLGTSMVADDLRPCVSADHEDLGTLHSAGVDEDDLTRDSLTKAETLVDKPLVDSQLHDFGVVGEGFFEAGFALLVF